MTDGKIGNEDDRWIFTEDNPGRELSTAAQLAAVSRVLKGFNDTLSVHCLTLPAKYTASTPETATTGPYSPKCRQPSNWHHHGRTPYTGLHSGQQRAHHQADRPPSAGYTARVEKHSLHK